MKHTEYINNLQLEILKIIPKEFYQEIAANEEKKSPEEIKQEINKLKEKVDTWKDELSSEEKTIVNEVSESNKLQELNTDLQKTQGKIAELPEEKKKTIETLDKLLEKSPQLEETTVIQVDISQENTKLTEGQSGHEMGYLVGSLGGGEREKDYLELSIPEGEHIIYMGASEGRNTVVLKRGTSFLITERSVIKNDKGDDTTKLTGKLLPKVEKNEVFDPKNNTPVSKVIEFQKVSDASTWKKENLQFIENATRETIKGYEIYWKALQGKTSKEIKQQNFLIVYKEIVDKLENRFKDESARIKESVYIFTDLTPRDLGFTTDFYQYNQKTSTSDGAMVQRGTIKDEQFNQLKANYQYGIQKEYITGSLLQPKVATQATQRNVSPLQREIILKLEVPKGTPMLALSDHVDIVLPRNQGIEITNITNKGTHIQIEGKLVPRDKITNMIKEKEKAMNETAKSLLHFNKLDIRNLNFKVVKYELTSLYASKMLIDSLNVFKQLYSNLPSSALIECIKRMNKEGAFTFVDYSLGKHIYGYYDSNSKRFFVNLSFNEILKHPHQGVNTILHETGHAFDFLVFRNKQLDLSKGSQEQEFVHIYIKTYLDIIFTKVMPKKTAPHDSPQEIQIKQEENKEIQKINQYKAHLKQQFDEWKKRDPQIIDTIRKSFVEEIKKDTLADKFIIEYLVEKGNLTISGLRPREIMRFLQSAEAKQNSIEAYILSTATEFFAGVFSYMYSPNPKERERIEKEAPEAVKFIKNKMEELLKKLQTVQ